MEELTQKNRSNWRTFRIVEDGVEIEATSQKQFSHKKLEFRDMGFRTADYDLLKKFDSNSTHSATQSVLLLIIAATLIIPACISLLSEISEVAAFLGAILFTALLVWSLVFVIKKNKKISFKKIHFSNGPTMTFYYRETREKDQVEHFLTAVDTAFYAYSLQQFLKRLEEKTPNLLGWLDGLHEKEVINHDDYLKYLKKVHSIDKDK